MDPLVKIMGAIDLIAALLIMFTQGWIGWQILAWILLIKGVMSLLG
jgi:hypothetical protein